MDKGDFIKAGIAAAQKWAIDERATVLEIQRGQFQYYIPVLDAPDSSARFWSEQPPADTVGFSEDRIQLERLALREGVSVHMGYGPRSKVLVFWAEEAD